MIAQDDGTTQHDGTQSLSFFAFFLQRFPGATIRGDKNTLMDLTPGKRKSDL